MNVEQAMGGHELVQDMTDAFSKLWECINTGGSSETGFVDVFLMFDEAHVLANIFDTSGRSNLIELQQALQVLVKAPLFTFFLSTTSKVHCNDASSCISDGIFKTYPFINFGFDQLMKDRRIMEEFKTLKDVTKLDCIAHMGRPL